MKDLLCTENSGNAAAKELRRNPLAAKAEAEYGRYALNGDR